VWIDRFLQAIIVFSAAGILAVLFYSGAMSARQTVFTGDYNLSTRQLLVLDDPNLSRNILGELGRNGRKTEYFAFKAAANTEVELKLNVPRLSGLENFRPALALMGPGLPRPPEDELKLLPLEVPDGYGVVISQDDPGDTRPRSTYDEPYTFTGYWEGQRIGRQLPLEGTYYIAIYHPTGQTGKFSLLLGNRTEVGWRNLLGFPWLWLQLRFWFEQGVLTLLVLGLLVAIAFVLIYYRISSVRKVSTRTPN
jgi:hypothetical protein